MNQPGTQTPFGTVYGNFAIVLLSDYVFFQEGPGLRKWQWTTDGMKVVNVKNLLVDGSIDTTNTKRYISLDEFKKRYHHFAIEPGDILVAGSGNTYGKVGRITNKDLPLMMNTSVIRFHSLTEQKLLNDYLYAFLRSELFKNQIEAFIIGSAQPNFGPTHLKQMKIVLPHLDVQRKIAAVLSAYDDLIENNTRRIAIFEEMAQLIYREWFVHCRFPGHEDVEMVEVDGFGRMPKAWFIKPMECMLTIDRINIRPRDFNNRLFCHYSFSAYDESYIPSIEYGKDILSNKYKVTRGSVLLSKLNPRIARVWLTNAEDDGFEPISSTEFLVVNPREDFSQIFLYCLFKSNEFRGRFTGLTLGTSTSHQRVKPDDFLQMPSLFPNKVLLNDFTEVTYPILLLAHRLRQKRRLLRQKRDLLLPWLISGKLDVSEIKIALN